MHRDVRHLDGRRTEEPSQGGDIRQVAGIEDLGKLLGKLTLADAVMGQRQEFDHGLASLLVGQFLEETIEGASILLPREELVAVNEMETLAVVVQGAKSLCHRQEHRPVGEEPPLAVGLNHEDCSAVGRGLLRLLLVGVWVTAAWPIRRPPEVAAEGVGRSPLAAEADDTGAERAPETAITRIKGVTDHAGGRTAVEFNTHTVDLDRDAAYMAQRGQHFGEALPVCKKREALGCDAR